MHSSTDFSTRELASSEGFRKIVFYCLIFSISVMEGDLISSSAATNHFTIAITGAMLLLLAACSVGENTFVRDIRGIAFFEYALHVVAGFSFQISWLGLFYDAMMPFIKPINYALYMLYVARIAWHFRDEAGRYYAFPPFDVVRFLLGQPYTGRNLPPKLKLLGYTYMAVAIIVGQVLLAYQIRFFDAGLYCIPAFLGIFWLNRHEREVVGVSGDFDQMASELQATKQANVALKQALQLAENETASLQQAAAALEQENATLKAASADQAETLTKLLAAIKAVSPLDQRSVAIFSGYHELVPEKQDVVEKLVHGLLIKFRKAKLYLVGSAPTNAP